MGCPRRLLNVQFSNFRTFNLSHVCRRYRSSHQRCFMKKGVLRNFVKFTGKHLCQSLFFNKETLAQVFSCEFYEISKKTFFTEHLWTTASGGSKRKMSTEVMLEEKSCSISYEAQRDILLFSK